MILGQDIIVRKGRVVNYVWQSWWGRWADRQRSLPWVNHFAKYDTTEPIEQIDQRMSGRAGLEVRFGDQGFFRVAHLGGLRGVVSDSDKMIGLKYPPATHCVRVCIPQVRDGFAKIMVAAFIPN